MKRGLPDSFDCALVEGAVVIGHPHTPFAAAAALALAIALDLHSGGLGQAASAIMTAIGTGGAKAGLAVAETFDR